jgi:1-acyl-sn-glycerol-3-phosphate acyltransferase
VGGFIPPIDETRKRDAIHRGRCEVESGAVTSFLIFRRAPASKPPSCCRFKKGGFIMAIKAQAPILPVAVQGRRTPRCRKGSKIIPRATVSIRIGEP